MLAFLLLAGLCLPGYTQKKTISVIGGSTAAGYGLPDADGHTIAYIATTQPRTSDGWNPYPDGSPVLDGTHINETGHLQLFNAVLAKNIVETIQIY